MFSDEYAVEIKLPDGRKASFFANKNDLVDINPKSNTAWLLVESVGDTESEKLIALPAESLELGTKCVAVPKTQLEPI